MKRIAIALVVAIAALGCSGGRVIVQEQAKRDTYRTDYMAQRRAAGASLEEIVKEIKLIDPVWYRELVKRGLAKK